MAAGDEKNIQKASTAYSLQDLTLYFLRLGTIGFGGPAALVGYMQRDLVEEKKWISSEDYKEGLALAQLAPGPLAAQLAIYLGYVHFGVAGATLAGIAFVLPSFFMVLALSMVYSHFGSMPWIQAVFYGVGAAVIGIIGFSAWKLSAKSLGTDRLLWGIYVLSAFVTIWTEQEVMLFILFAGVVYWLWNMKVWQRLAVWLPVMLGAFDSFFAVSSLSNLGKIALFFAQAGAFVFGSGLAIVPFLYSGVVKEFGWLNEQQFLDAVAIAMITPGPVVITVAFIGYLVAGVEGASVAALATFLPCYLFTILPAPYFKKYGKHPGIKSFVEGVTAAAIGAIAGAVVVLGKRSLIDLPTMLMATAAVFVLWRFKKAREPYIILAAAVLGLLLKSFSP